MVIIASSDAADTLSLMNDEYQIPKGTYNYVVEDDITKVVDKANNLFSMLTMNL